MGMFSSISNNAMLALNNGQAVAGRPNIGMPGNPNVGVDIGFGYRDLPENQPGYNPVQDQMPVSQPAQTPGTGFQTTYQQLGYNSLEAMKDAMDPNWRNSPGQPGFGPAPMPEQQQMQMPMQMPMPMQQPQMQMPISQPQMQMPISQPPGLPTGSSPGGKSATPGDNFSPGSNFRPAPGMPPNVQIGSPGGMMPGQQTPAQFTGGLRPAPRNFRPPPRRPGGALRPGSRG